jgi:potassium/hydrogen antiporter
LPGLAEPQQTAVLLALLGILVALSVLLSRPIDRLGLPVVLLFLVLGMLGGSQGIGGIEFTDYRFAVQVGTVYLVLILFDGGMSTSPKAVKRVFLPAAMLATVGVALTAILLATFARLLGIPWGESLLLSAVVSSTDAAAVFAVLRGGRLHLTARVGQTLEVESCVNDPMAVILTITIIQALLVPGSFSWMILATVPLQLFIGALAGAGLGYLGRFLLRCITVPTAGLYPALTLAVAFLSFGATTLIGGSGFLAVFVTGLVLGNTEIPNRTAVKRVHDALAWLSQIGIFLMFGLLVFPADLLPVAWEGLGLGLFLAFVARPLAVLLCLLPFRYPLRESAYIGWVGLRGAVPIILASFPLLAQVEGAQRIFNAVFFIVVVSTVLPGATVRTVTRRLRLGAPFRSTPSAVLDINSAYALNGEILSFLIEPSLAVCGAKLADIVIPPHASVVLVVRGADLIAARGNTVLLPGDHVYVFTRPADLPYVELLFGTPERDVGLSALGH